MGMGAKSSYIERVKSGAILAAVLLLWASAQMAEAGSYLPKTGDPTDLVLKNLGTPIGIVGEEGGEQIFSYPTGMIGFKHGRVAWSEYVAPSEQAARDRAEAARQKKRSDAMHKEAERIRKIYLSDPNAPLLSDDAIVERWESYALRFPAEELPAIYLEAKSRLADREAKEEEARIQEEKDRRERERLEAEYARLDRCMSPMYSYDPFVSYGTIISIQENALCELRSSRAVAFRAHNAAEVKRLDGMICDTKNYMQGIKVRFGWAPLPTPIKSCPPVACK